MLTVLLAALLLMIVVTVIALALMNAQDDIDYLLSQKDKIEQFEAARQ